MSEHLPWLAAASCLICGAVAIGFKPKAWENRALLASLVALAGERLLAGQAAPATAWLLTAAVVPAPWLVFSLLYARGNGPEFLRRWKVAVVLASVAPAAMVVLPGVELVDHASGALLPAGKVWALVLLLACLGILVNLENTFRGAVGMARWRIKFVILGSALIFGVKVYVLSQSLLFSTLGPQQAEIGFLGVILGCGLMTLGLLRSGMADHEIYISRPLLQGSITLVLAGVYFLAVGLLANVVARLGGIAGLPAQALVLLLGIIGLAVLLLSDRYRMKLQRAVSRHFRRPQHDFREIWTRLSQRTSRPMEPQELGRSVAEVISESFGVLGVTVLKLDEDPPGFSFLHATGLASGHSETLPLAAGDVEEIAARRRPFPLERDEASWAQALCARCPRQFGHGGERLAVPLVAGEKPVGLMVLTDRVNGTSYSHEEMDLLKCIGDQLAGALQNRLLVEEVLQARELEAFQTLSTFFVHDLKNAAHGLSLMLQNLPVHFDDPEFRRDAIRGVSRTADRINGIIRKLGALRHGLELRREPCRLDEISAEVLDALAPGTNGACAECDLRPVPEQSLDREAMKSVVTNLLANAREASAAKVRIETRLENGHALVVVSDDGQGMTPEFVHTHLFQPFRSTKSSGLGIGMFQCRKIVEAHGGRIEVETRPGAGTSFTVSLPVAAPALQPDTVLS